MDRWRRWLPRRPTSRAGLLRARVTVLALLAVTVALALLLAVRYRLAWPPVAVSILGGVPTLYVAWLAVPGVLSPPESLAADIPAYGRPVARWDPVELGVHQVMGGGPMPAYVRRLHDELLRAVLDPAISASRLVVVRGGSSTGKTRAAYEAVADLLADWYLDYPLDPDTLNVRLDNGVPARTVLWLGELRQYADADGGPKVLGKLGDLLNDEGHLIITTLWPEHWTAYTAAARAGLGAADPAGTTGRLLERLPELTDRDPAEIESARGGVIDVPDQFTPADLEAAARTGDPVLAAATAAAAAAGQDGQVTQYLAGVPDLLGRYAGHGGNPYGQAVITAAMDVTRLGHASPMPAALIQEATVGYLTGPQRTKDIASWRDAALAWAAEELRGTVRALEPVPSVSGTGIAGYRVADYLIEYASQELRATRVPTSTWDAILSYVRDPADAARLADSARSRRLYQYAIPLYRRAADGGDWHAATRLDGLLAERGDLEGLRARADAGDWVAAVRLTELLAARGDLEGLRTQAATGDGHAATVLARLLAQRRDLDRAVQVLRAPARADDGEAAGELVRLLAQRGDLDEAAQILRARIDAGDGYAAGTLARLLAEGGDLEALRSRADAGDSPAAWWLAELLADYGHLDELRDRANAGDVYAALNLADLLTERGDLEELRARADVGDWHAAMRLAGLLTKRGDLEGLRARADAGDRYAAAHLAEILLEILAHFRWPQNAGFLEEYLLARHQLQLDSSAFAPLRRDERKAWDRAPGAREAYIAPALKPDGSANPRWITRSDWDIERRIVATPRTERLFDLYKIYVLAGRPGSAEASYLGPRTPVDAVLEKYAQDILDTEPPSASASDEDFRAWRTHIRERTATLIGEIRRDDEPDRHQIARQLAGLSDRERIWGRDATIEAEGRSNKRPNDTPASSGGRVP